MEPFSIKSIVLGLFIGISFSYRGYSKKPKSLSKSGAIAAFIVGFLHVSSGLRGFSLLVFYYVGTKATKYKHNIKIKKDSTAIVVEENNNNNNGDEGSGHGTGRNASQVFACSILSCIYSIIHVIYCGKERSIDFAAANANETTTTLLFASQLTCAIIAHHATCLAGTFVTVTFFFVFCF